MKNQIILIPILFLALMTSSYGTEAFSKLKSEECSQIIMKNGDIIQANIIQITTNDIKYRRCGKPNDPEINISKKEVLFVKASDGATIYKNDSRIDEASSQKTNGFAIAGFIFGLLGFLTGFGAILGLVFSAIGLSRIKKNPKRFRGRGLAIAGLVLSIIVIGIVLLILLLLLAGLIII
jgi:hypothetical protein